MRTAEQSLKLLGEVCACLRKQVQELRDDLQQTRSVLADGIDLVASTPWQRATVERHEYADSWIKRARACVTASTDLGGEDSSHG